MTTSSSIAAGAPNTNGGLHENAYVEIEALGEWMTITRKVAPEMTAGGIHLPDTVRAKQDAEYVGTIVCLGDDVTKKKPLKIGDRIVYSRCFPMAKTGTKDEIFSLVHVDNVMGRVHGEAKPAMAPESDGLRQD